MIKLFCYNPSSVGYNKLNWYGLWFSLPKTQKQFKQRGIQLIFEDDKELCDGIIGNGDLWDERIWFNNTSYKYKFIMEHCDSIHAGTIAQAKEDDRIKVIFKHSHVKDFDKFYQNNTIYTRAEHFHLIAKDHTELFSDPGFDYKNGFVIYGQDDIDLMKRIVKIGQPQIHQYDCWGPNIKIFKHLDESSNPENVTNTNRKYDFVFSGKITYGDAPFLSFIRNHRTVIYNNLKKLEKDYNCVILDEHKRIGTKEFYELLRNSKVSISPYGIGAICFRDFESVSCGCEIVSPDKSYIYTKPDIFNPENEVFTTLEETINIDCLKETIDKALQRFNDSKRIERRLKNYKMLRDEYNSEDYIDNMCSIIKQCMNK